MTRTPPVPKRPPRPATPAALRTAIRDEALRLGFDAIGFAPAQLTEEARTRRLEDLGAFVAQGLNGDMGWLGERTEQRADPSTLWPEARTVVSLALNYGPETDPRAALESRERAAISVYAQGRDYHEVVKGKLKALGRFIWDTYRHDLKVFVDTAPLMEKPAAQASGLGWQGKHTNLVSRQFGSWLFLGELLLSAELPYDAPESDHCGQCRACLDACPTNAFLAPYRIDARRCISYLTIENKGSIPEELREAMGNRIYGCDDCQLVCPWNKFARTAAHADFKVRHGLDTPKLVDLFAWTEAQFDERMRGSAIYRIGYERWLRNIAVALGNAPTTGAVIAALQKRAQDSSALVREHVDWALARHAA